MLSTNQGKIRKTVCWSKNSKYFVTSTRLGQTVRLRLYGYPRVRISMEFGYPWQKSNGYPCFLSLLDVLTVEQWISVSNYIKCYHGYAYLTGYLPLIEDILAKIHAKGSSDRSVWGRFRGTDKIRSFFQTGLSSTHKWPLSFQISSFRMTRMWIKQFCQKTFLRKTFVKLSLFERHRRSPCSSPLNSNTLIAAIKKMYLYGCSSNREF